ncbi:hypothetical protein QLS71_004075 [Mariniflexile litorale]|uniref:Glycosyl hydrolase family 76 n=1 Tax=Mariniflexile litorale TaxID=3045158 RepID=A0AAU7EHV0_9FLAO|nr:hypothetical protein [Mariniflexile sp. KMM 9835]MDQ8210198.1 hypothetical protein [Mariniflexile sp. KMM 9835]
MFRINPYLLMILLMGFASCNDSNTSFPDKEPKESIPNPDIEITISDPLPNGALNFNHFNHLYNEINFNGKKVGIINIYSEYPNYTYAIEPNEGFTCVDDVSRGIVMLTKYLELYGNQELALEKLKNLTEFVLQMQNQNGYFNNFIWNDLTINTEYRTSLATLNWWSFRALWAIETAYPFLKSDEDMANRIAMASEKLTTNIKRDLPTSYLTTEVINTIELPTWLPGKSAADQSAILILGLLKNYTRTGDNDSQALIDHLAKGIILMQKGDADNYPYGAFLSSENLWHAWGNNQAYALLKVGQVFNNQEYIDSALLEIENFYPWMLQNGFAEAFWINKVANKFIEVNRNKYPQIAYGVRPMLWAAAEAYHYSNDAKYLDIVNELGLWLSGKNDANKTIYNPSNGVCFDGITGPNEVNKNSGAESTLETLLMLLEIEKAK